MDDGAPKSRVLFRVVGIHVDGIVITSDLGEHLHVLRGDHPRPFVGVANVNRFVRVGHEQQVIADMGVARQG